MGWYDVRDTQTIFRIQRGDITGLHFRKHKKNWKKCKWCKHHFLPKHNKEAYCDETCRYLSRTQYINKWVYHRRKQEQNGTIINDRNILNVGTGELGGHRCETDEKEYEQIQKELKKLGLR